jgi:hypothetical protein
LQHPITYMFLFHNRVLQCPTCYWGWSCQFVFVGSTVWLPYLLDLFLLISVHVHTRVLRLTVPLFPYICWSVAVHPLYHVFLYTVLLPGLGMLIWCGLLSHQIIIITTIIIIIITISFMHCIYTHIPETNPVPKQYNVAANLSLLFMVPISLVPALTL